jgi:phospholipid N-methyltransferase
MNADAGVLFGLWLQKPLHIAAANPSGARLADTMARCIDQFPAMTVIDGDATRIGQYLAGIVERLAAVVSSLLIKWFPIAAQYAAVRPCLDLLGPDGRFFQVTNAFSSPLAIDSLGITGQEVARVWRNLLPAQIWAYSDLSEPLGVGEAK